MIQRNNKITGNSKNNAQKERLANAATFIIFVLTLLLFWNSFLPRFNLAWDEKITSRYKSNPDFFAYYTAGKSFEEGLNPYLNNGSTNPELEDWRLGKYSRYIYPPFALPLYQALSRIDYETARGIWFFIYALIYFLALLATTRTLDRQIRPAFFLTNLAIIMISSPFLYHIRQGQIDMMIIGLIIMSFVLYHKNEKTLSALLLVLATLFKLNPLFLLLYFVIYRRDLGYVIRYVCFMSVLVLFSLLYITPSLYFYFIKEVLPSIATGTDYFYNQTLFKLVAPYIYHYRFLSVAFWSVFTGIFYLLSSYVSRKTSNLRQRDDLTNWAMFTINLIAILILLPISWHMAYVWLTIPVIMIFMEYVLSERRLNIIILGLLAGVIMVCASVDPPKSGMYHNNWNLWGGVLLLVTLLMMIVSNLTDINNRFLGSKYQS